MAAGDSSKRAAAPRGVYLGCNPHPDPHPKPLSMDVTTELELHPCESHISPSSPHPARASTASRLDVRQVADSIAALQFDGEPLRVVQGALLPEGRQARRIELVFRDTLGARLAAVGERHARRRAALGDARAGRLARRRTEALAAVTDDNSTAVAGGTVTDLGGLVAVVDNIGGGVFSRAHFFRRGRVVLTVKAAAIAICKPHAPVRGFQARPCAVSIRGGGLIDVKVVCMRYYRPWCAERG